MERHGRSSEGSEAAGVEGQEGGSMSSFLFLSLSQYTDDSTIALLLVRLERNCTDDVVRQDCVLVVSGEAVQRLAEGKADGAGKDDGRRVEWQG